MKMILIINILFWIIISVVGSIILHITAKYIYLTLKERRHPRFRWDDDQEKVSPLMVTGNTKQHDEMAGSYNRRKQLSLSEIEAIVNNVNFNNYE